MIYFDNAATTLLKPAEVFRAVQGAMRTAAGYGRSGHQPALRAGELVYACREQAAALFGVDEPERVVFTLNATHALNTAIHALAKPGAAVAVTGYEHNSVMRPLAALGCRTMVMRAPLFDQEEAVRAAERAAASGAELFIVNHVSNVFGFVQPLERIDALLTQAGIPMILDASQSAGVLPIDCGRLHSLAALCCPGHKALYGPQGTGILLVRSDSLREPLMTAARGACPSSWNSPPCCPTASRAARPTPTGLRGWPQASGGCARGVRTGF